MTVTPRGLDAKELSASIGLIASLAANLASNTYHSTSNYVYHVVLPYHTGVEDDGYPRGLDAKELSASIGIIASMAASLAATARLVEYVRGGFGRRAALVHIKANAEEGMSATDLRVAGETGLVRRCDGLGLSLFSCCHVAAAYGRGFQTAMLVSFTRTCCHLFSHCALVVCVC